MYTSKLSVLKYPFIVIDFGSALVKCGFAGTPRPHAILKTPARIKSLMLPKIIGSGSDDRTDPEPRETLAKFCRSLYLDLLLIDPRTKKVAITENLLSTPTAFKEALARALLIDLKVPALLFVPSHLAATCTLLLASPANQPPDPPRSTTTDISDDAGDVGTRSFLGTTKISALLTSSNNVPPATTHPLTCALVIDCGYSQITIVPVCGGLPQLSSARECPVSADDSLPGAHTVIHSLRRLLVGEIFPDHVIQNAPDSSISPSLLDKLDDEEYVEDLVTRVCIVASSERSTLYDEMLSAETSAEAGPLTENKVPSGPRYPPDIIVDDSVDRTFTIPGRLREAACETYFRPNLDGVHLASLVIDSISRCPIDCRKDLAQNIVIIGGLSMIPGFKNRLKEELVKLSVSDEYSNLAFTKSFKCHKLPCLANYASWLGASIMMAASSSSTGALGSSSAASAGNLKSSSTPSPNTLSILARYRSSLLGRDRSSGRAFYGDVIDNLAPFMIDVASLKANGGRIPDWTTLDSELRPYYDSNMRSGATSYGYSLKGG